MADILMMSARFFFDSYKFTPNVDLLGCFPSRSLQNESIIHFFIEILCNAFD